MSKIIDADKLKKKLIAYSFSSFRMTVTGLIDECEELPTMQSNEICRYCKNHTKKECRRLETYHRCFEGKRMIEVNDED